MKKAYLNITTWKDSLIVADHYYGTIHFVESSQPISARVNIESKLTQSEAKRLNIGESDYFYKYKPGDECGRFFNKEKLIKTAIKVFKDKADYDMLIEGEHCILDPQKILVGPKEIKEPANKLYEEFESFNGWECKIEDDAKVTDISKRWIEIVGE